MYIMPAYKRIPRIQNIAHNLLSYHYDSIQPVTSQSDSTRIHESRTRIRFCTPYTPPLRSPHGTERAEQDSRAQQERKWGTNAKLDITWAHRCSRNRDEHTRRKRKMENTIRTTAILVSRRKRNKKKREEEKVKTYGVKGAGY